MERLPSETFEIGDEVRVKDNPEQYDVTTSCVFGEMLRAGGLTGTIKEYQAGCNTWDSYDASSDHIYYINFDRYSINLLPTTNLSILDKCYWFGECLELLHKPTPISEEDFLSIFD